MSKRSDDRTEALRLFADEFEKRIDVRTLVRLRSTNKTLTAALPPSTIDDKYKALCADVAAVLVAAMRDYNRDFRTARGRKDDDVLYGDVGTTSHTSFEVASCTFEFFPVRPGHVVSGALCKLGDQGVQHAVTEWNTPSERRRLRAQHPALSEADLTTLLATVLFDTVFNTHVPPAVAFTVHTPEAPDLRMDATSIRWRSIHFNADAFFTTLHEVVYPLQETDGQGAREALRMARVLQRDPNTRAYGNRAMWNVWLLAPDGTDLPNDPVLHLFARELRLVVGDQSWAVRDPGVGLSAGAVVNRVPPSARPSLTFSTLKQPLGRYVVNYEDYMEDSFQMVPNPAGNQWTTFMSDDWEVEINWMVLFYTYEALMRLQTALADAFRARVGGGSQARRRAGAQRRKK